jgi:hypothetical protein
VLPRHSVALLGNHPQVAQPHIGFPLRAPTPFCGTFGKPSSHWSFLIFPAASLQSAFLSPSLSGPRKSLLFPFSRFAMRGSGQTFLPSRSPNESPRITCARPKGGLSYFRSPKSSIPKAFGTPSTAEQPPASRISPGPAPHRAVRTYLPPPNSLAFLFSQVISLPFTLRWESFFHLKESLLYGWLRQHYSQNTSWSFSSKEDINIIIYF